MSNLPPGLLPPSNARASERLLWCGLILVLAPLLTRFTVVGSTLPAWDSDPLASPLSLPALGPAGSMLADALVLLGAAMLLLHESLIGRRINPLWLAGAAVGAAAAGMHGWCWQAIGSAAAHGTLGNQRIGAAWVSAVLGAVAVMHAARDGRVRRAVAGVFLGMVVLLALRGAQQVYIEHPITIAAFDANPDRYLAAHGWSAGSPMALSFVRRMRQPEASGWTGLSNIFASFMAAGLALAASWLVGLLVMRKEAAPSAAWWLVAAAIAAGGGAVGVYLADSKGGFAVTAIGLGLVILGWTVLRPPAPRPVARGIVLLGPLCILGMISLIALRGLIGERLHELSILFRWFYLEASARIVAAYPLTGVGPDGYQLAYMLAKDPLSPEEVSSPHSIIFDWLATLGVGGVPWVALLFAMSGAIGRALLPAHAPADAGEPAPSRDASRAALLTLSAATIAAAWIETPYITLDLMLVRVGGLAVGGFVAHALITSAADRALRIGLVAGALALLVHAQIELTASHPASAGLFFLLLAAAAAGGVSRNAHAPVVGYRRSPLITFFALCTAAVAGMLAVRGALPAWNWEKELQHAAATVRPIADIIERRAELSLLPAKRQRRSTPATPPDDLGTLAAALSNLTSTTVPATEQGLDLGFARLNTMLLPAAADELAHAQPRFPDEWRVGREIARLYLQASDAAEVLGDPAARTRLATLAASGIVEAGPGSSPARARANPARARTLALTLEEASRRTNDRRGLGVSRSKLEEAFTFDPYDLDVALRLFHLSQRLDDRDEARRWAAVCIRLDDQSRLDRDVRGLMPPQRREVEQAAAPLPKPLP